MNRGRKPEIETEVKHMWALLFRWAGVSKGDMPHIMQCLGMNLSEESWQKAYREAKRKHAVNQRWVLSVWRYMIQSQGERLAPQLERAIEAAEARIGIKKRSKYLPWAFAAAISAFKKNANHTIQ